MAAHVHHTEDADTSAGMTLLLVFPLAILVALIPICLLVAVPSVIALVAAMVTVIGFAIGLIVILSRVIG